MCVGRDSTVADGSNASSSLCTNAKHKLFVDDERFWPVMTTVIGEKRKAERSCRRPPSLRNDRDECARWELSADDLARYWGRFARVLPANSVRLWDVSRDGVERHMNALQGESTAPFADEFAGGSRKRCFFFLRAIRNTTRSPVRYISCSRGAAEQTAIGKQTESPGSSTDRQHRARPVPFPGESTTQLAPCGFLLLLSGLVVWLLSGACPITLKST